MDANRTPTADANRSPQPRLVSPRRRRRRTSQRRRGSAASPRRRPIPVFPIGSTRAADPGVTRACADPALPAGTHGTTSAWPERAWGCWKSSWLQRPARSNRSAAQPENRYRERWWLFVAKNWQFRPAHKDGQPVRFLTLIPLTGRSAHRPTITRSRINSAERYPYQNPYSTRCTESLHPAVVHRTVGRTRSCPTPNASFGESLENSR